MRRWLIFWGAALLLVFSAPARAAVLATDYDAFWLWGGVAPQPALTRARSVYLLQGQISAPSDAVAATEVTAQGVSVTPLRQTELWLVYRALTLRWSPRVEATLIAQLRRWRAAGNTVRGIQIDFDARTRHLQDYARFLRELRARLPADCQLSITGLLDWSTNASPAAIDGLRGTVDEVVVQTYQGRHTIADYAAYLPKVARLRLPFKIGIVQGGEWRAPAQLARNPWFRGYVVFLLNPRASSSSFLPPSSSPRRARKAWIPALRARMTTVEPARMTTVEPARKTGRLFTVL